MKKFLALTLVFAFFALAASALAESGKITYADGAYSDLYFTPENGSSLARTEYVSYSCSVHMGNSGAVQVVISGFSDLIGAGFFTYERVWLELYDETNDNVIFVLEDINYDSESSLDFYAHGTLTPLPAGDYALRLWTEYSFGEYMVAQSRFNVYPTEDSNPPEYDPPTYYPPAGGAASVYTGLGMYSDCLAADSSETSFLYADASSELTDSAGEYPAWKAFDGNDGTVWSEADSEYGIGETLFGCWDVTYDYVKVFGVAIRAGHQRSSEHYYKNSRPGDVTVVINDNTYSVSLYDGMDWQVIVFDEPLVLTGEVNLALTIESAYAGNKYKDTCVSTLDLLVEPIHSGGGSDGGDGDHYGSVPSVDMLMNDCDFFALYPDYEPAEGLASGRYVNDDGSWKWWDYLRTSYSVTVYIYGYGDYASMFAEGDYDSEWITDIPVNEALECYGWTGEWALCEYNGYHGWIPVDYLSYQ